MHVKPQTVSKTQFVIPGHSEHEVSLFLSRPKYDLLFISFIMHSFNEMLTAISAFSSRSLFFHKVILTALELMFDLQYAITSATAQTNSTLSFKRLSLDIG